ncbi:DUF1275 family protein [Nocardiopsis oceani]
MGSVHTRTPIRRATALALLTACAGGMDLLSIAVLGGVFSGIITGNLVHAGQNLGSGHWLVAATALAAVAAFGAGVWVWARLLGPADRANPRRTTALLATEVALLTVFTTAWILLAGAPPHHTAATALLVLAAFCMGAQSAWARTTGASTTYLTGTLATALAGWATGDPFRAHRAAITRLSTLFVGALATMLVLLAWPWAAALLPLGCALTALVLWRSP